MERRCDDRWRHDADRRRRRPDDQRQRSKTLASRTIENDGTLLDAQTAGGYVEHAGAALLDNTGVFDIRSDASWENHFSPAGTLTLNNSGTLRKSQGSGDFLLDDVTLNNSGAIEVLVGVLLVNGLPV